MRKLMLIAGLLSMSLAGTSYAIAQGMSGAGGMGTGAGMTSGREMRSGGGMEAGGMRSTSDDTMELRPTRSNRTGAMHGLNRANSVAGTNGTRGRTNAMTRQTTSDRMTGNMDRTQTGSVLTRSNRGGAVRGLDRADAVAGTNGMRGRSNARMRQMTE